METKKQTRIQLDGSYNYWLHPYEGDPISLGKTLDSLKGSDYAFMIPKARKMFACSFLAFDGTEGDLV